MFEQNVIAHAKGPIGSQDFGFLGQAGKRDIFVTSDMLKYAGFSQLQMKLGVEMIVDVSTARDGSRRVEKIHSLGGIKASYASKQKPAGQKIFTKPVQVSSPVTLSRFCNVREFDGNKRTGERLWQSFTPQGEFVQFLVVKDEIIIRQLGNITPAEARMNIGKQLPVGHGVPTNIGGDGHIKGDENGRPVRQVGRASKKKAA